MKKVLTLLALFTWVSVSFAQLTEYQIGSVQNNEMERSYWYGYTSNASSAFIFDTAAEYLLRVPENEFGVSCGFWVSKVNFIHLTNENFTNYTGEPFNNETYYIRFYTGTHYETVTYLDSLGNEQSRDSLNPGTLVYEFSYTPTQTGAQVADIPEPFIIPKTSPCGGNESFCISVYAPYKSAAGLCPANSTCVDRSYAYLDENLGWHHYQFSNNGDPYVDKPWLLSIYVEDDWCSHPLSNFRAEMYDPDGDTINLDTITTLYVNPAADSIYAFVGTTNLGIDSSYGSYYLSLYVDGETPYYFWENRFWREEISSIHDNEGFHIKEAICGMNDLANLGISFPFDLCFHIDYESTPEYECGYDPDLSNNTYCVHYTDQEDPGTGIHETTNTLNVYPNPACNIINVDNAAGAQISIFNIAGQEVMAIEAANANETINISNLKEGVYVVRVVNGNEVATRKVSIVR